MGGFGGLTRIFGRYSLFPGPGKMGLRVFAGWGSGMAEEGEVFTPTHRFAVNGAPELRWVFRETYSVQLES